MFKIIIYLLICLSVSISFAETNKASINKVIENNHLSISKPSNNLDFIMASKLNNLKVASHDVALLEIIDPGTSEFSDVGAGSVAVKKFEVKNIGNLPAKELVIFRLRKPFFILGGKFPGVTGTCIGELLPGETCEFVVEFRPTNVRDYKFEAFLFYNNGIRQVTTSKFIFAKSNGNHYGKNRGPALLKISADYLYDFGKIKYDEPPIIKKFKITNIGFKNAERIRAADYNDRDSGLYYGGDFRYSGDNKFPGTNGTCGKILKPGESCFIDIMFSPSFFNGKTGGTISIHYGDGIYSEEPLFLYVMGETYGVPF